MEVVRRDWTELAKRVQRELYERLFKDRPVDDYLCEIVGEVRGGRFDDEIVYRKALRKRLEDYEASAPHVVAARKMSGRPHRIIAYVITENGPEPADERRSQIDHEHYVQRQVRAVAEPVLSLLGLDFDRVIGDDSQLSLF
jgi:DNA polymerase-2